ncbi:hypothetical protein KIH77_10285 [Bifidobacterium sp. 82T24]|uniref:hypothetical protein n=1 Tax=Bifidobacterium pluvialisilvae TaxID=2834436 RepID=UPI001C59E292|nr:hypothetical protein [Bifidobacterium pluvialisilvae]MBW3089099.1 hypothetical protein [Bifidobacterium pluvialisilvae]
MYDFKQDPEHEGEFSFILPGCYGAPGGVRVRVNRLVPSDLSMQESADVAVRAFQLVCLASDVARGRLSGRSLDRNVTEKGISRLEFMAKLLRLSRKDSPLHGNLPPVPLYLYGTVLNPDHFDACAGLTIGKEIYQSSIVLRRWGSRWVCTFLDFG